jgi:hypothetical protein
MGKNLLSSAFLLMVMLAGTSSAFALNFYARQNGAWNSTATWSNTSGGPAATTLPGAADSVFIEGGFTVSVNTVAGATCNVLVIGTSTSGTLTLADNSNLVMTVVGGVFVDNGFLRVENGPGARTHTLNIGGNLFVSSSAIVNMRSPDATDEGNIVFNGTSAQTFENQGLPTLRGVTVNNAAGLTLLSNMAVNAALTMTNGLLNTNGFTLTVVGNIAGGSSTSYINTEIEGSRLVKSAIGALFTFPIGTSSHYLPMSVTPGAGTPNYTVYVYPGATTNGLQSGTPIENKDVLIDAVWNVASSTSTTTTVTLNWVAAQESSYFSALTDVLVGISDYSSGAWQLASATAASNATNFATRAVSTSSANLPLGVTESGKTLPVRLANFSAVAIGNQVKLNWNALTTHLNSSFEIERSANGTSFTKLGTKAAALVGDAKYDFVDAAPLAGNNYYRIKTIDETGKVGYSKSLLVRTGSKTFALNNLFPSVTTGNLNVVISSSTPRTAQVNFVDINGRVANSQILSIGAGNNNYAFNVNQLPAGLYTVVIYSQDERLESRFIKQ